MYRNGSFVWFDLMSTDVKKAQGFYTELFNWKIENFEMGKDTYPMIKVGEHTFGGFMPAPEGMPTMWNCNLSVDDVDARCEAVKKAGGKVMKEPFDIPTIGKGAVVLDPTGAAFSLFQATENDPAQIKGAGTPHWMELWSNDVKKSSDFYKDAFGYSVDKMPMPQGDYFLLKPGPARSVAGMMQSPDKKVPPMWLLYIEVDDADALAKKATKLGGKILNEAVDAPGVGRFGILQDPTGGVIGFIKPAA